MLLGTYQGEDYPADEDLDYETNVNQVMRAKFAGYYRESSLPWETNPETDYYVTHYDPEGEVKELKHAQFLSLKADGIKASYRMREWFKTAPAGFLKSYLLIKPKNCENNLQVVAIRKKSWPDSACMPCGRLPGSTYTRTGSLL